MFYLIRFSLGRTEESPSRSPTALSYFIFILGENKSSFSI